MSVTSEFNLGVETDKLNIDGMAIHALACIGGLSCNNAQTAASVSKAGIASSRIYAAPNCVPYVLPAITQQYPEFQAETAPACTENFSDRNFNELNAQRDFGFEFNLCEIPVVCPVSINEVGLLEDAETGAAMRKAASAAASKLAGLSQEVSCIGRHTSMARNQFNAVAGKPNGIIIRTNA